MRSVPCLLRTAFQNRKQHAIDLDKPKSRAIWKTQLEGHNSEGPFSETGPSSFERSSIPFRHAAAREVISSYVL
jgi:hypothetical protein